MSWTRDESGAIQAKTIRATVRGSLRRGAIVVAMLGLCNCAATRCPPAAITARRSAGGSEHRHEARANKSREALQRLAESVEALDCDTPGLDFQATSEVLANLADSLDLRTQVLDTRPQKIRDAAQALASSEARSAQLETLRDALASTLSTLLAAPGPLEGQQEYRLAVGVLSRSLDALKASAEGAAGCESALRALRAATDATFLALHGDPPFGEGETKQEDPQPLSSMRDGLESASASVLALGRAKWRHAREPAARTLLSFAAMAAAADCRGNAAKNVERIRFEAERLTRSDALSFGQPGWIKSGLVAALDALDALEPPPQPRAPSATSAARRAVGSIDAHELLGFQRAAVQDAFRATLDAFAIVARSIPECRR